MNQRPVLVRRARRGAVWSGVGLLGLAAGLAGCVTDRYPDRVPRGTRPAVAALGERIELGDAVDAFYRPEGPGAFTAVLVPRGATASSADAASLTVLRVAWRPRVAATPLERTATNATVRHLVFTGPAGDPAAPDAVDGPADELLGLFTGAGFVGVRGEPGGGELEIALREADLRLTDRSVGYDHPLRRTVLTTRVVRARRDAAAVSRWLTAAGVRASAALGYPAWVRRDRPETPTGGGPLISFDSGARPCVQTPPVAPSGA